MGHKELLARLEEVEPPSAVAWFVLLCTYYQPRLAEVENGLVGAKVHPLRLPEAPLGGLDARELRAALVTLRHLAPSAPAFDRYALGLVKALDRTLEDVTPAVLDAETWAGFDGGQHYRVRRLVNPIAAHCGREAPPQARQGTLAAYARRMTLVPAGPVGGHRIECRRLEAHAPAVAKRLLQARAELSVALWPFEGAIDYPLPAAGAEEPPDFVVLAGPRNEPALVTQVEAAIDTAQAERTTVLIFPELAFSPGMLAAATARLARHGSGGYPVLTVAGLCHAPHASNGTQVNEAVVLGPDGRELHRHRKLSRFAGAELTAEGITTGDTLGVLETACGNLATPICLDTFAAASKTLLLASHATVLLVPSLSATTGAHQHASQEYAVARWVTTFVCNRTLKGFAAAAPSFSTRRPK